MTSARAGAVHFDATSLITRALNYVLRQHPPTYLGLRLFAESTERSARQEWTLGYLNRKAMTQRSQSYWRHSALKGENENGDLEFRPCVIGSPTSHLAESLLISQLASQPQFANHPSVYSYLWPRNINSNQIYAHFLYGYQRRERDIAVAMAHSQNNVTVIMDLKQFYPSVNKSRVEEKFVNRISASTLSSPERTSASLIAGQLLYSSGVNGLPVGPPLSHVLANVALENVDFQMSQLFEGRYFRYVDDVAVVAPESEANSVIDKFKTLITAENLSLNDSKTDVVKSEEWRNQSGIASSSISDGFGSLLRRLQLFLVRYPERFAETKAVFADNGFSLPFSRLRSVVQSRPHRRYLKFIWDATSALMKIIYVSETPASLLNTALSLRTTLLTRAEAMAAVQLPALGMSRRWAIQRIRFTFNRLLYLVNRSEYGKLIAMLPYASELNDLRCVLEAMLTGDITSIIRRPGPPVTTFAQMWQEIESVPSISWSSTPRYGERDSIATLATYGIISIPPDWIGRFENDASRRYLRILDGASDKLSEPTNVPSYLLELQCLKSGWANEETSRLMRERFNDDENLLLSGLDLGGGTYLS